ncbi:MAG: hypothetical protein JO128_06205 [Alphaproteobacteria bacterium]|nr:hypothetical protein [Alphaproteobacteria bacterium]
MGSALVLGGCDYVNNALWPSLTGPNPSSSKQSSSSQSTSSSQAGSRSSQDIAGDTSAHAMSTQLSERDEQLSRMAANNAQASTPSYSSAQLPAGGTEVGRRANQLASDAQKLDGSVAAQSNAVQQLRAQTVQSAEAYQGLVAQINARLQVGTTPGNPILQAQWDQANTALDNFAAQIGRMSEVSNQVAADASTAAFLLESVRAAYSLSGAVEEDHRHLAQVEDQVNRQVVTIDRLLNDLSDDISRQSAYMSRERTNMTALSVGIKNGELFGNGLANRAFAPTATSVGPARGSARRAENPASAAVGHRPLVVIRFDRPNPAYEQALYTAVSRAMERRPNATFDLVAVSPTKGTQAQMALASASAKRQAETVLRSLTEMGLPPDRVTLSSETSAAAQTNEVQLFVR